MSVFQSLAWQSAWWKEWGEQRGFALIEPPLHQRSGIYIDRYRIRSFIPVNCIQFVGTNYRRLSTPRTEYNCLSSCGDAGAARARLENMNACRWTEAVFRDVRAASAETSAIGSWAVSNGWTIREIHRDKAYSVQTSKSFDEYLATLGSGTRLKLFNRRKVLAQLGRVALENYWPGQPDSFFDLLNGFHEQRWGTPCFNATSLKFHKTFLQAVGEEGGLPDLSVLTIDGVPISVVYNVVYQSRSYNLQSGYVENFHKKVALGMLHLGYCLERAFADETLERFDLLAGCGKKTDYKKHIATDDEDLVSLMVVRSRFHRALYRAKDALARGKAAIMQRSNQQKTSELAV